MAKGRQKAGDIAVANDERTRARAPWPAVDRWPIVLGSSLTVQYLASVYRICQSGYRQQYVDALDELLEKDCHTFCVLSQRAMAVAGCQLELVPAEVQDPDGPEAEEAKAIRDDLQRRMDAIPMRAQALYTLVFSALYYGAGGHENLFDLRADGWWIRGLSFIHSRRISYPDQGDWSPHIWDQGAVDLASGARPTQAIYGLRTADYPGKFCIHTPQLRGDYPTREGLGRVIAWFMLMKLIGVRGAAQFIERFAKPFALAYYNTGTVETQGKPRVADDDDIKMAAAALQALGVGSLSSATLPDSVKVDLSGPGFGGSAGAINHKGLVDLLNDEISKAVRGGTLTTSAGDKGARSLGEVHEQGDVRNARLDAACLADTLDRDLLKPLCDLNHPGRAHLCPTIKIHVEKVDPDQILERALKIAAVGGPVDGRWLADTFGVRLTKRDDPEAVRLAPLKPVDLFALESATSTDPQDALAALAGRLGINVTPGMRSAMAALDQDDLARAIRNLMSGANKPDSSSHAPGDDTAQPPGADSAPPAPAGDDDT